MENKDVVLTDLAQRMSLRLPQKNSLDRLAAAVEAAGLKKGVTTDELETQLAAVRALDYEGVTLPGAADYDWPFLSFAFALATGVGKTRLMGAIIAYLYRVKGLRNFVVIAPGKTVYEKLIADFTEGTPKYVFKGLSCFASLKPIVVTGDTYQNGAGIVAGQDLLGHSIVINVFTIQKLNERGESHEEAQRGIARIRRVNETLGMSYFDYLKGCEDLVVLMDEAHHCRADEAGKTVSEMQPVLGIEMTATPRVNGRRFGDILYEYDLAKAMSDGFVKEPAVVRRQNFVQGNYAGRQDELDQLKLQDAMIVHETTKAALTDYAFRNNVAAVKPFVLVVAPNQEYADVVEAYIKSAAFYEGRYGNKVIKVYSNQRRGANNDDAIAQLLMIERPESKIEIVIHVNMLTEGWDVTNLYTIVPLRAANSANLVEQTIGRGLRLPYGKRTGVTEIDTLSIVSHDKFDDIIAAARNLQINMRPREVPTTQKRTVLAAPTVVAGMSSHPTSETPSGAASSSDSVSQTGTTSSLDAGASGDPGTQAALNAIGQLVASETASQGVNLTDIAVQTQIASAVAQNLATAGAAPNSQQVSTSVRAALALVQASMIEIPRITITPGATTMRFADFELDTSRIIYALRDDRLVYDFVTDRRVKDVKGQQSLTDVTDERKQEYARKLATDIAGFDDIDYDVCSELAGKLVTTCIDYLAAKLDAANLENCIRNNVRTLAEGIRAQLLEHAEYDSGEEQVNVQRGACTLKANVLPIDLNETPRPFDQALSSGEKSRIRNMVFTGFTKCLFTLQKFDSEPERVFSEILERTATVQKWFKPTLSNLRLYYGPNEYTPDFVVESDAQKLLVEVKASNQVEDSVVQLKKQAALKWCHYANEGMETNDKKWVYLLVPDTAINSSLELQAAIQSYGG